MKPHRMTRPARPRCVLCDLDLCTCAATSTRGDLEAARWAAERGVKLEHEYYKEGLCGDRFPSLEKRMRVADGQFGTAALREYRERAELRAGELAKTIAAMQREHARLARHVAFLGMHLNGDGMDMYQIAAAFRKRSHSSASAMLKEIVLSAAGRDEADREHAGRKCRRPRCPSMARVRVGPGRPPDYCSDACRSAHWDAMKCAKLRVVRNITESDASRTG